MLICKNRNLNYLNVQKNKLVQSIPLCESVQKFKQLLHSYIKKLSIENGDLLLQKHGGGQLAQNYYSNILKKTIGIGSSMVRKIYATENTNSDAVNGFNKITNAARASGHAASTRIKYYVKT